MFKTRPPKDFTAGFSVKINQLLAPPVTVRREQYSETAMKTKWNFLKFDEAIKERRTFDLCDIIVYYYNQLIHEATTWRSFLVGPSIIVVHQRVLLMDPFK